MKSLIRCKFAYILLAIMFLLSAAITPQPAYAWSAVTVEAEGNFLILRVLNLFNDIWSHIRGKESPRVVRSDKGTHQLMLRLAYQLLEADPAYIDQKEYFPTIDGILDWEGVVAKTDRVILAGGEWRGRNAKSGGPDAAGKSKDSYHYYNPLLQDGNRGNADTSVERHFEQLLLQMYSQGDFYNRNKANVDTNHNAAWSAHYLADVYVPYHTVGVFTADLEGGGILNPDQAGPEYLYMPEETRFENGGIDPDSIMKPPDWSGMNNDFTDIYSYFKSNYLGNSDKDWFDPWYYNGIKGLGPNTVLGSHQLWESWAHENITAGKLYKIPAAYSKDWENAVPQFNKPLTNIENQAAQAKAFTIAAANETKNNMALYTKSPDAAFNKAAERVATIWRASLTALKPEIEVLPPADPTTPNKLIIRGTVKNLAKSENPTGIQMRLTVTGGTVQGEVIPRAKPVVGTIKDRFEWEITVNNPESYKLKLEVIGKYHQTPDLGYAVMEKEITQTGPLQSNPPAPPAQSATTIDLSKSKFCNIRFTVDNVVTSGRPQRRTYVCNFEGSFTGNEFKGFRDPETSGSMHNQRGNITVTVTVTATSDPAIWKITGYSMQSQYDEAPFAYEYRLSGKTLMDLKYDRNAKTMAYATGDDTCRYINGYKRIVTDDKGKVLSTEDEWTCNKYSEIVITFDEHP